MLALLKNRTALAFLNCALSLGVLAAGLAGVRRLPEAPVVRARRVEVAPPALAARAGKLIPLWLLTEEGGRTPEFSRDSRTDARDVITDRGIGLGPRETAGRKVAVHIFESVLNL